MGTDNLTEADDSRGTHNGATIGDDTGTFGDPGTFGDEAIAAEEE